MNNEQMNRFSQEIYIMLLLGPVREKLFQIAHKYGMSDKELRYRIIQSLIHLNDESLLAQSS